VILEIPFPVAPVAPSCPLSSDIVLVPFLSVIEMSYPLAVAVSVIIGEKPSVPFCPFCPFCPFNNEIVFVPFKSVIVISYPVDVWVAIIVGEKPSFPSAPSLPVAPVFPFISFR